MTVTVDINVFLDVIQRRQPHYPASANVMGMVESRAVSGVCPAHALTTIYYLVRKLSTKQDADTAMDWILDHFQIGNLDMAGWREARALPMDDFEDGAVAATANASQSDFIITRDVADFAGSPVPAITPVDFLGQFPAKP